MVKPYLLGIDIGTSAIKCVVFDRSGQEAAVSKHTPNILRPQPGWSELDMNVLWKTLAPVIREAVTDPRIADGRVEAVGISGTCCGSWLTDDQGQPIRNAILWNDGRAADVMAEWQQSGALDEVFRISGNTVFPGYTAVVLRWLKENEPELYGRAGYSLYCKDWVRFKLTGRIAVDRSDIAYMPYDIRRGKISNELLRVCGIEDAGRLFPEIIEPGDIAGVVQAGAARETGLVEGIPVVGGLVDVAATTLGAGAYLPGQSCSIVGTSFLNNLVSDKPSFEPFGIGAQTQSVNNVWIRSMINTAGTLNLQWFLDQFFRSEQELQGELHRDIYELAEELAAQVPIGAGGVIYHPYLNTTGVISPFVNPTARAQFFGISIEHTREHLLRAVYEGVALSMLDNFTHFPQDVDEVYISGGGARSAFWCQMFADCTGKAILVPNGTELGARGVAILGGIAGGVYQDLPDAVGAMVSVDRVHRPDPDAHQKYAKIYQLYRTLYQNAADAWWQRHYLLREI